MGRCSLRAHLRGLAYHRRAPRRPLRPPPGVPRRRRGVHGDLGCVRRFEEVQAALAVAGVDPTSLSADWLDLPLLFHYGRSDATVAFYGANLPVADVEEAVFSVDALRDRVTSFMLVLGDREMEDGKVAVRERTKGDIGAMSLDEFKQMATRLVMTRALQNNGLES